MSNILFQYTHTHSLTHSLVLYILMYYIFYLISNGYLDECALFQDTVSPTGGDDNTSHHIPKNGSKCLIFLCFLIFRPTIVFTIQKLFFFQKRKQLMASFCHVCQSPLWTWIKRLFGWEKKLFSIPDLWTFIDNSTIISILEMREWILLKNGFIF